MYLLAKFDGHRFYGNGDINSYINSYMITSERIELTFSIRHIEKFLKSGVPIYNFEIPDTAGRKTTREEHKQLQTIRH